MTDKEGITLLLVLVVVSASLGQYPGVTSEERLATVLARSCFCNVFLLVSSE